MQFPTYGYGLFFADRMQLITCNSSENFSMLFCLGFGCRPFENKPYLVH